VNGPRVVSLLPSATEIVAELGLAGRLVGRSHECDYPPEVRSLPVCTAPRIDPSGSSDEIHRGVERSLDQAISIFRVDSALLRALEPTHVVTQIHCEVCAVSLEEVERSLSDWSGARPELVPLNPASLSDALEDVRRIARALGVPDRGLELSEKLRARMGRIADRAAAQAGLRVATIEWLSPLMTAGNWMPELVEMAGGRELFGRAGSRSSWIEWASLRAADPDVLLVAPCGFPLERVEREIRSLTEREGFRTMAAARRGCVFLLDGNRFFNRPGPRLAESLEMLAEIFHPDLFRFGHEGTGWTRLRGS